MKDGWDSISAQCSHRLSAPLERRPVNGLNVEPIQPQDRCIELPPSHWPNTGMALRWLASGGSALVFGRCRPTACPLGLGRVGSEVPK